MTTKIEKVKLSEIHELENNPRWISKDEFERLKKSVKDFPEMMEVREIVVDETGAILGGNQRYKALVANGETETTVKRVTGWTDEMKREFVIKDNHANGEWDTEILANNYDPEDLKEWMGDEFPNDWAEEEKEIVEDEVPEAPEEPKAKLGDIYQLGSHRLMCGDSTKMEDVEKLMNGQKADMVFTDPPYGINIVSDSGTVGGGGVTKAGVYSKVIADDTTETAEKAYKILKNYSNKLVIWGGNYFVDFLDFSDGWLIWDKRGDMNSNDFADGEMAWCSFHTPVRIYKQIWNGMIREGEHENRVHPTQKPIKILGEILKDFTKDGEIVLDVFGGSGSTLMTCEQLGRKCYMMELDPHYVDTIIQRWENFTGEKAVKLN